MACTLDAEDGLDEADFGGVVDDDDAPVAGFRAEPTPLDGCC